MKKKYCSPDLELKRFTLSADILGNSVESKPEQDAYNEFGDPEGDEIIIGGF